MLQQPEADRECIIHLMHCSVVKRTHSVLEPLFINGADLLQQDNAVFLQAAGSSIQRDMGRQLCFIQPACDSSCDHGGAVTVADIILYNKYGTDTALFRADNRAQIRIINFASLH